MEEQQQQQLLDSQLVNTTSSVLSDILQATGITDINVQDESTNSANEKGECVLLQLTVFTNEVINLPSRQIIFLPTSPPPVEFPRRFPWSMQMQ